MNTQATDLALIQELMDVRDNVMRSAPVDYYPRVAQQFPKAALSSVLCKLADEELANIPAEGISELYVIGNEGSYLVKGNPRWREFLSKWADSGKVRISYFLRTPSKEVLSEITKLQSPSLQFFSPKGQDTDTELPATVRECLDNWNTHHFVLCKNPNFLWIEGNHPENSTEAYNCAFFDTRACQQSPEWEIYNNTAEHVWPHLEKI